MCVCAPPLLRPFQRRVPKVPTGLHSTHRKRERRHRLFRFFFFTEFVPSFSSPQHPVWNKKMATVPAVSLDFCRFYRLFFFTTAPTGNAVSAEKKGDKTKKKPKRPALPFALKRRRQRRGAATSGDGNGGASRSARHSHSVGRAQKWRNPPRSSLRRPVVVVVGRVCVSPSVGRGPPSWTPWTHSTVVSSSDFVWIFFLGARSVTQCVCVCVCVGVSRVLLATLHVSARPFFCCFRVKTTTTMSARCWSLQCRRPANRTELSLPSFSSFFTHYPSLPRPTTVGRSDRWGLCFSRRRPTR